MSIKIDLFNKSITLLHNNRITEGKKELEKLIFYDSDNIYALNLLAICEYKYCNFKAAEYYIDKSIKIKNNEVAVRYKNEICKIYNSNFYSEYEEIINSLKDGEYYRKINKIEEIKDSNPYFIEPYILLAMIYMSKNKFIKARKNISRAYKMDVSNPLINNIYFKLKL